MPRFGRARNVIYKGKSNDGPTRLRRTTPITERAEKANVLLPPTPGGIRSGISDGSPSTVRESKKRLHKHQKACHKKVALAEATADAFAPRCKRHRALKPAGDMARYARKMGVDQQRLDL